ncbi:MAG: AMP-binding protein, partial [Nannocystaceae bacterium]
MERGSRYWPHVTAVVDVARGEPGRWTYTQMNERANRLARWLRDEAGVGRGERVGLVARNGVEYLDTLFACAKIGATLVPYNWREHSCELRERVEQTTPRVLVFDDAFADKASELQKTCPFVSRWLHIRGAPIGDSVPYEPIVTTGDATPVANEAVDPEDIACLLFTGGTTGRPRGARISLRMIAWNTLNTVIHELERGDVTITHTPMFHTGGLLVYTLPLLTLGGTVVIMREWTATGMLELIAREQVSILFCVPTQYQLMMQVPAFKTCSLASLRFMVSGGAPLPLPVLTAYQQHHNIPFKQGFGMTEFGPGMFSMGPEHAITKAGSIGRPNYFIDALVVDPEGQPVATGEVGELVVKGPSIASGYHGLDNGPHGVVDEHGWFHTGDLARVDADGFFYIVDRKKDMFI